MVPCHQQVSGGLEWGVCRGRPGGLWAGMSPPLRCVRSPGCSDSHLRFAVGDEVRLWGRVELAASPQRVAGARLGRAELALVAVPLSPERLLVGVPALEVGGGVVGQGVRGHLVGAGLLSVLLGGAVLGAEGPRLALHSDGVQRQVPFGGQLGQVAALGVEVLIYLVGWTVGQTDGGGEERAERGRERRERDS